MPIQHRDYYGGKVKVLAKTQTHIVLRTEKQGTLKLEIYKFNEWGFRLRNKGV